jgi:hypothetical protein
LVRQRSPVRATGPADIDHLFSAASPSPAKSNHKNKGQDYYSDKIPQFLELLRSISQEQQCFSFPIRCRGYNLASDLRHHWRPTSRTDLPHLHQS